MNTIFDFRALVDLCRQTHEEMQGRVARIANTALAARNWMFGWYIVEYEDKAVPPLEAVKRCLAGVRRVQAEL